MNQLKWCQHYWIVSTVTAGMLSFCILVMWQTHVLLLWQQQQCLLSSHLAQDPLCGSFMVTWNISWSSYWYQWLLWWWEVIIAMATETLNVFVVLSFYLLVSHYSLKDNQLTDTGAIVLATALQHNKSLEELKWVVNWVSYYQEKLALNEDHWPWAFYYILLRLRRHTVV